MQSIVHTAYSPYVARIGREPGPMLNDYDRLIRDGHVHVTDCDGVVQGAIVLLPLDEALLLDNVAVAPGAQGRGFGRAMMRFAEQPAVAFGYRSIRLYTNEAMTDNISLYSRSGYAETHRIEEKELRRVYMSKRLVSSSD